MVLRGKNEDRVFLGCFFLPHDLGSRRDFAGKKRGERTLAGGPMRRCHMVLDELEITVVTQQMVPGA